ncbi:serine--tRNA ligase [Roseospira marina]|uniref:Serine--tRNA ligase n=1 Tax=Roseospira marina TaxID=140057 RepID=A0A5M6IF24_9PROT|nr:serine--tRNA ligase [Roseospira marina]KAA5606884.1 serine--tRNA ligase [Roseospira marina]MBB4312946.1 seryl-tRNA synthetase [Roseospira marina]MBB5086281.1 seryl-tRNA synthetase [Roseospira marina]
MHDIKWIRDNPEAFDAGLARRGLEPVSPLLMALDERRRASQSELNALQSRRNEASKAIGKLKREGRDASAQMEEVATIKARIAELDADNAAVDVELQDRLAAIPNLPDADVPDGPDEDHNVEIRRWGEPRAFDFEPKDHVDLGAPLGMDFETAGRLSGARFVILKDQIARLERALVQFMLELHTTEHGYREVNTPALVRDEALFGTAQLPKFAEDLFKVEGGFWLIPTAEVTLTNMVSGQILEEAALPLRFTAFTQCFRSEAGSAGKDTRGMIRMHQFEKVELVSIVHPDRSREELDRKTACAEAVLKRLGLPFRTVALCTGDLGFASHRTHDLEVWLPAQGRYREISSCSNVGAFQARRMDARFRPVPPDGGKAKGTAPVHTLNGSGLAVGRTLVAVLENYQNADGSVTVPEALRPYMGGLDRLRADV